MVEDGRSSRKPRSEVATVSSGASSPQTAIDLRSEETLAIEEILLQYDAGAGTPAVVEVYDEPDGTAQGDLSDKIGEFRLSSGDTINPDMVWKDVEDDVVLLPDGNSDDAITVTIGGWTISG